MRSAFLVRAGLSKEAFIGTGVVIACLADVSRLSLHPGSIFGGAANLDYGLLTALVLGAFLGNRYLKKMTMRGIQRVVAVTLFAVAIGLVSGVL